MRAARYTVQCTLARERSDKDPFQLFAPVAIQKMTPNSSDELTNPRTKAMLHRLQAAMRNIEAEIATHHGIYPFNHGRVTQSELCRRADVKKATLQTPLHKDTTRVEVMHWLDSLTSTLLQSRDATRQRVTAETECLTLEVRRLSDELIVAYQKITTLTEENTSLRIRLGFI